MNQSNTAPTSSPHEYSPEPFAVHAVPGYQAIVDHLRREISLGRIIPGDRLPAERKLAEQYGVARETLRQALRILEGSGQIVIQRGAAGGPVVQGVSIDPESMLRELRARKDTILQLIEFRLAVEPVAAGYAALRRDDGAIRAMEDAQSNLSFASTRDESRRADTAFHLAVAMASQNGMLERAVEESRALMFAPTDLVPYEFLKDSSHQAHQKILDAIKSADEPEASAAMVAHICVTREEFERVLGGA